MNAKSFFSDDDKKLIEETIGEIEKETSGELAVMVVDRCDSYPEARILAGFVIGGLASLIIADLFFGASLWYFVPCCLLLSGIIGFGVRFTPQLHRMFVLPLRIEQKVKERATRAFFEKQLYRTRDETGVLFFISLFEHRLWVLADKGIYTKISDVILQQSAASVADGMRNGYVAKALCAEMRRIGKVLTQHFPVKPEDKNELPDSVFDE